MDTKEMTSGERLAEQHRLLQEELSRYPEAKEAGTWDGQCCFRFGSYTLGVEFGRELRGWRTKRTEDPRVFVTGYSDGGTKLSRRYSSSNLPRNAAKAVALVLEYMGYDKASKERDARIVEARRLMVEKVAKEIGKVPPWMQVAPKGDGSYRVVIRESLKLSRDQVRQLLTLLVQD